MVWEVDRELMSDSPHWGEGEGAGGAAATGEYLAPPFSVHHLWEGHFLIWRSQREGGNW